MKSVKIPLLEIAKWLLVVLLILFVASQMATGKESATEFSVMEETVVGSADLSALQSGDNQMIKRLYGLDPSQYEGMTLYYPTTNMGAEEILLVKLSDVSQQEEVLAAIDARLATQKSNFDGYGVGQTEMLNAAVVEPQGNYILFVVGDHAQNVRQAFLDAL